MENNKPKYTGKPRGFAAMSKEQRVKIASMGGKASHGSPWKKTKPAAKDEK